LNEEMKRMIGKQKKTAKDKAKVAIRALKKITRRRGQ